MPRSIGPTPTQLETLDDIKAFLAKNGFSPTVMELAHMAGITNNAVGQRIDALVRKGCLNRRPGASRSLVPVNMVLDSSGNEHRHPLYMTVDQLQLLSDRLKSGDPAGHENDELLMLVETVLSAASQPSA